MRKIFILNDDAIYLHGFELDGDDADTYDADITVCSAMVQMSLELDDQFRVLSSAKGTLTVKCPSYHVTGGDGFVHEFEHDELEKKLTIQSFENVFVSGQLAISDEEFINDKIKIDVDFINSTIEIELNN